MHKGKFAADEQNWISDLTCIKMTQLHDASLVTRVRDTNLIGYSLQGRLKIGEMEKATQEAPVETAVRELEFSSVQFICCEHALTLWLL